jgi:hypothetical protein
VAVVLPVLRREPLEERRAAVAEQREAAVCVEVVHDGVCGAVEGDAHAKRDEGAPPGPVETDGESDHHHDCEHDRKEVVRLPAALRLAGADTAMVAAVQALADPVHHRPVRQRGDRLHRDERDSSEEHSTHTVTLRLAPGGETRPSPGDFWREKAIYGSHTTKVRQVGRGVRCGRTWPVRARPS